MTTETSFSAESNVRISVDQFDDGVWLSLQGSRASMFTPLTRAEAEKLVAHIQFVLSQEVTA